MAEQYASFQGKEPNIDVNLFVNALTQGIAAGNAQKTTFGAIAGGISDAISGGIQTAQGVQAIRANEAILEVAEDPAVIEARKQGAIGQGQVQAQQGAQAELQQKVLEANQETAELVLTDKLKNEALIAEQTLGDTKTKQAVMAAIARGAPEELNSILNDPGVRGTFSRDTGFAVQSIAGMQGKADPALIDSVYKQVDAVELEKRRANALQDQAKRKQIAAEKNDEEFTQSQYSLQGLQGVADVMTKPGFKPQSLKLYPEDSVVRSGNKLQTQDGVVVKSVPVGPTSTDKGYILAYGDTVLDTLNRDEGRNYGAILENFKKGAAARPDLYPTDTTPETEVLPADAALRTEGTGLAARAAPLPATATNQNIIDAARKRNADAAAVAQSRGQSQSYEAMVVQGTNIPRQQPVAAPPYISTSQTVKTDPAVPALTRPVQSPGAMTPNSAATETPEATPTAEKTPEGAETPKPTQIGTVPYAEEHLSKALGGANVTLNTAIEKPQATKAVVDKINAIPSLANKPAFLKGIVAIESAGNPNAKSGAGAAGLFQFMMAAASDVGLSEEDRFDPEKAVPAGIKFVTRQYEGIEKQLALSLSQQGMAVQVDPRMTLAAFNGGLRWIQQGIRAGNTTWPQMKEYLISVKSPEAEKENIEYVDKVITASIPFIVGGNVSDDSYVRTLLNFGIVEVA